MFLEKQKQISFGFAQGRLSTHHPQAEKHLGPVRKDDKLFCGVERKQMQEQEQKQKQEQKQMQEHKQVLRLRALRFGCSG
jgi:hypothetical protein